MAAWAPKDENAFVEECVRRRGIGETWRKISEYYGLSRTSLYEYFDREPKIRTRIDKQEESEIVENLKQTGLEVAIKSKNVKMLEFWMKAKLKMFDTPPPEDKDQVIIITQEQAKEIVERLRVQEK